MVFRPAAFVRRFILGRAKDAWDECKTKAIMSHRKDAWAGEETEYHQRKRTDREQEQPRSRSRESDRGRDTDGWEIVTDDPLWGLRGRSLHKTGGVRK